MTETKQKILIVDDREDNLFALEKILSDTGAQVVKAMNGNVALKAVLNHEFALTILDVQMPEMDGYELAELIRGEKKTRHLPIIFLSAVYSDDYHVFRGYKAGAVDFITKPFNANHLLSKVRIFLQLDRQRIELLQKIELEKSKSYLENILLAMTDAVIVVSPAGAVETINQGAASLLGLDDVGDAVGKPVSTLIVGGDVASWALTHTAGKTGEAGGEETFLNREAELVTSKGELVSVLVSGSVLRSGAGKVRGSVLVARDIRDRKIAEEKLKAAMSELRRSNEELARFAYVASHDLQEPLRMVASYVQLLERRYKGRFDEDADEFINYTIEGAVWMKQMIEDLLEYSRVDTRGRPLEPTDCEAVFDRALRSLQVALEETNAEVTHDPLPTVMADKVQLARLFQNLIGNAIKFRGQSPPRVHVSVERQNREWIFSVRDNGIGIESEYLDRIFLIFQHLHARKKYPGTGGGLAISRRIVERHGGRIWAKSTPGKGSVFFFTIPVRAGEGKQG